MIELEKWDLFKIGGRQLAAYSDRKKAGIINVCEIESGLAINA